MNTIPIEDKKYRLKPKDLVTTNCNRQCSLWRDKITLACAQQVEVWVQEGYSAEQISLRLKTVFNLMVAERSVARHIAVHMGRPEGTFQGEDVSDLQVIEQMIKVGARNLRSDSKVRISPEMTIKAIELKYKLTQGNVFQDFLAQLGQAMDETVERGDGPEIQSEDEAQQQLEE